MGERRGAMFDSDEPVALIFEAVVRLIVFAAWSVFRLAQVRGASSCACPVGRGAGAAGQVRRPRGRPPARGLPGCRTGLVASGLAGLLPAHGPAALERAVAVADLPAQMEAGRSPGGSGGARLRQRPLAPVRLRRAAQGEGDSGRDRPPPCGDPGRAHPRRLRPPSRCPGGRLRSEGSTGVCRRDDVGVGRAAPLRRPRLNDPTAPG